MIRPFRHILWLIVLMMARPASAQQYESYVSTDSVTIGDRFALTLIVGHDGSRSAVFPHEMLPDSLGLEPVFGLGDFEIVRTISQGGRAYDLGGRIDSVVYEATTFALDTARVAGIPIGLATGADTLMGFAPPLFLQIGSLVPQEAEEIKDLADLAQFDRSLWPWIAGILALLAVIYGLWWWRRHGLEESGEESTAVEPTIPPYEEALERLAALQSMDLSDAENIKPFYVELTAILRTYVGRRAHLPALESTTRELLLRLRASLAGGVLSDDVVTEIDHVLTHADLVKFADLRPILEQTRAMVAETKEAIEGSESAYRQEDERMEQERQAFLEQQQFAPSEIESETETATDSVEEEV